MEASPGESSAVAPSLLETIDVSKPLDPAYDIGMASLISTQYEVDVKHYNAEKENQPPKRKKVELSLNKKDRFGTPISPRSVKKAAKGVVPENTKLSNNWAVRNLMAWVLFRNSTCPEDPVPEDLLSCSDADIICKCGCVASFKKLGRKMVIDTQQHCCTLFYLAYNLFSILIRYRLNCLKV